MPSLLATLLAILLIVSNITNAQSASPTGKESSFAHINGKQSIVSIPVLSIKGAIGPAVSDYISKKIQDENTNPLTPAIIITLDTPGGLSASLREINKQILSAQVPTLCLVYPQGARAASAGTYILYACHIAAMSPATSLGAATPVMIAGGMPGQEKDKEQDIKASAMQKKVLNDSVAYIRSLAQLRKRNVEWAEDAVIEAATLSAQEAYDQNVINLIANNPEHLVEQLDGQKITINEQELLLTFNNAQLNYHHPDWRNRFIATITDPNIAYILMLIGIYGLLLEFYNPGIGVAGITGGISLFVALYAFQLLPINYAGFALILLGITLLVVESMVPSFGLFGIGGIAAFTLGSIFLIDTEQAQFQVSLTLIYSIAITTAAFIIFVLGYLWRLQKAKVVTGQEALLGAKAKVLNNFTKTGFVWVKGECWAATTSSPVKKGQIVKIKEIKGLKLLLTTEQNKE